MNKAVRKIWNWLTLADVPVTPAYTHTYRDWGTLPDVDHAMWVTTKQTGDLPDVRIEYTACCSKHLVNWLKFSKLEGMEVTEDKQGRGRLSYGP